METAITHLGTPELHKRHKVMIEGGSFPRSKVMDQCVFDLYLMYGDIDLRQHRAAEFVLSLASKAGLWVKGSMPSGDHISYVKGSRIPFGMMPYGDVIRKIRDAKSKRHSLTSQIVIVFNRHVKHMGLFKESMDYVSDNIMFYHKNPLKHLE